MPRKNRKASNLHGDHAGSAREALLLIDVMNDLEFPGGDKLARRVGRLASRLSALAERARRSGIPVVYVNDNFGQWRSDFRKIVDHCAGEEAKSCSLARALRPKPADYFVLKPEKSAFHHTPLDLLLRHLGVETLILAGLTTDSCVYLTACEAHMRDFGLKVPADCVAAIDPKEHRFFLRQMEEKLGASTRISTKLRWGGGRPRSRGNRKKP